MIATYAADYYVRQDGQFLGPYDTTDLKQMLTDGNVQRNTPCISSSNPEVHSVSEALYGIPCAPVNHPSTKSKTPQPPRPLLVRNRGVYIILGLLFGCAGFHNFYAGYHERAAAQLGLGILAGVVSVFIPIAGIIAALGVAVWAVVDICTTEDDASGSPMA